MRMFGDSGYGHGRPCTLVSSRGVVGPLKIILSLIREFRRETGVYAVSRGCKGALEAFDLRHQKIQVCTEKFEEFDARTGEG